MKKPELVFILGVTFLVLSIQPIRIYFYDGWFELIYILFFMLGLRYLYGYLKSKEKSLRKNNANQNENKLKSD